MMLDFEVRAKGFDRTLQNLAAYDQISTDENRRAMNSSINLVVKIGGRNAPWNTGFLRAKIQGEVRQAGPGEVLGVIGSYAPHGAVMELGAGPHWPNVRNLNYWVERKLRVSRADAEAVTFLIGRAISRGGLRARPYLMPAYETAQPRIRGFFEGALANTVRRLTR
jgi:hypothetical protein